MRETLLRGILLTVINYGRCGSTQTMNISTNCPAGEFSCAANHHYNLSACIERQSVCDGIPDCVDGEDEKQPGCHPMPPCGPAQYRCDNGLCISSAKECDHDNDCGDMSDEHDRCKYRPCEVNEATCLSGRCIPRQWLCDGFSDCRKGEDEDNCAPCNGEKEFRCLSGKCIALLDVCNKRPDCDDASDEDACGSECASAGSSLCDPLQRCVDLPAISSEAFRCLCRDGYALLPDGRGCRDINECLETPGVCEQFCTNTIGSYTCTCNTTFYESSGGPFCREINETEPSIIFSDFQSIFNGSTTSNRSRCLISGNTSNALQSPDFIIKNGLLVLEDVSKEQILSFNVADPNSSTEVRIPHAAKHLNWAIDWVNEKLYFVGSESNNPNYSDIAVTNMNGDKIKYIWRSGSYGILGIAVHPGVGYVYFTDVSTSPCVARIGMDGTMFTRIVTTKLATPSGLTIDYTTSKVIWGDSRLHVIEMADLDGKNRVRVLSGGTTIPFVRSLTTINGWMYWSDQQMGAIIKAKMFTDQKIILHLPSNQHYRFESIKIWHKTRQPPYNNPCAGNAGCSHYCLLSPSIIPDGAPSYSCICPSGFSLLTDQHTCVANCSAEEFLCGKPVEKCITKRLLCDGERDCADGSDEGTHCPTLKRDSPMFQCSNTFSIPRENLCDGVDDCGDNSDEAMCGLPCDEAFFRCAKNGNCIPDNKVCNGASDCKDGSDEDPEMCRAKACDPETEFKCQSTGACIPAARYCDGMKNCPDGSDEPVIVCAQNVCQKGWRLCNGTRDANRGLRYHCIPNWRLGDTRLDCVSGWDEFDGALYMGCSFDFNGSPYPCHGYIRRCTKQEHRCDNKNCIDRNLVCNHQDDCGDGSDEFGCTSYHCDKTDFPCNNGACIRSTSRCDGEADCADLSDEINCVQPQCNDETQFRCNNGVCIMDGLVCNGAVDCLDHSDEEDCLSARHSSSNQTVCAGDQLQCNDSKCNNKTELCGGDANKLWPERISSIPAEGNTMSDKNQGSTTYRQPLGFFVSFSFLNFFVMVHLMQQRLT